MRLSRIGIEFEGSLELFLGAGPVVLKILFYVGEGGVCFCECAI